MDENGSLTMYDYVWRKVCNKACKKSIELKSKKRMFGRLKG